MLRDTARRLRRRMTRARHGGSGTQPAVGAVRAAVVEVFERKEIAGWVDVEAGTGPVRVHLCVNDTEVAKTWAAPADGRRVDGDLLWFRFGLNELWKYTRRRDQVSVRIDGNALPIVKKGTYYHPRKDGAQSLGALRKRLSAGYVFGQNGKLQLSKALDTEWQHAVIDLYGRLNAALESDFDIQAFLCYGTLLGAVRDHGFIGHDLDFDCAYVSKRTTGQGAAEELGEIALALMDRGFTVVPKRTCLALKDDESNGVVIDLFHLYQDDSGRLNFPFGVAGDAKMLDGAYSGVRPAQLAGREILVPAGPERMVEVIYGSNWRTPNPGFKWQNDRTVRTRDGIVPVAQVDEVARANIAPTQEDQRSPLHEALSDTEWLPETVVQVGSALGGDAVAIAQAGKRVIGLERSVASTQRAERNVAAKDLAAQVEFRTHDVADPQQVASAVEKVRREIDDQPVAVHVCSYVEFSDRTLRTAVDALESSGHEGDYLIADFRRVPAGYWPKDKSENPVVPVTLSEFIDELTAGQRWSLVAAYRAVSGTGDAADADSGVVVAHKR